MQIVSHFTDAQGNALSHEQVYSMDWEALKLLGLKETLIMDPDQYQIATEMMSEAWEGWDRYINVRTALFI